MTPRVPTQPTPHPPGLPVEEQLRHYADAIDPSLRARVDGEAGTTPPNPPAGLNRKPLLAGGFLVAAAALLVVFLLPRGSTPDSPIIIDTRTAEESAVLAQPNRKAQDGPGSIAPIPILPIPADTAPPIPPPLASPTGDPLLHIIVPGDFMSTIAERYNVTVEAILRANPDLNPNILIVGQTLVIPDVDERADPLDPIVGGDPNLGCVLGECGWLSREDGLAIRMAEFELLAECMDGHGEQLLRPTIDELIELHGGWRPHGILGIGREAAAAQIGYRDSGWGGLGSPSQAAAVEAKDQPARARYNAALAACWKEVDAHLRPAGDAALLWTRLFGADATQGERLRGDPRLDAALNEWRACVQALAEVEADTPNTLAREWAFLDGEAGARERKIATSDAVCQKQADLEAVFWGVQLLTLEAELGDDPSVLLEWAHRNLTTQKVARVVLAERGIEVPAMD